jgi:hypothetical protein
MALTWTLTEFLGEHFVELGSVAGVVVGSEVSESLVSSDSGKSHVLLDELSSGRLGGMERFGVVEEGKVTEVVFSSGGSDGEGHEDGDLILENIVIY